jgi:hypothetical protein
VNSIERVEISLDNGITWRLCRIVKDRPSPFGWYKWEYDWIPMKCESYTIMVRATDNHGRSQKVLLDERDWQFHAMANSVIQPTIVTVLDQLKPGDAEKQEPIKLPKTEPYLRI